MASGFTHPTNKVATPYRVHDWHTCNACWKDPALRLDHGGVLWRPRRAGTPRPFEGIRLITAEMVLRAIDRVPGMAAAPIDRADPADLAPARLPEEMPA